jgi:hypothetical protein
VNEDRLAAFLAFSSPLASVFIRAKPHFHA